MIGSLCVSTWWQKVQVSVLFRASSKVCCASFTGLWQASQALTFTGPCNTLNCFTSAWHSAVTQLSRATAPVGFAALLTACGFAGAVGAASVGPNTGASLKGRTGAGAVTGAVAGTGATFSGAGGGAGGGFCCASTTADAPNRIVMTEKITRFMTHLA